MPATRTTAKHVSSSIVHNTPYTAASSNSHGAEGSRGPSFAFGESNCSKTRTVPRDATPKHGLATRVNSSYSASSPLSSTLSDSSSAPATPHSAFAYDFAAPREGSKPDILDHFKSLLEAKGYNPETHPATNRLAFTDSRDPNQVRYGCLLCQCSVSGRDRPSIRRAWQRHMGTKIHVQEVAANTGIRESSLMQHFNKCEFCNELIYRDDAMLKHRSACAQNPNRDVFPSVKATSTRKRAAKKAIHRDCLADSTMFSQGSSHTPSPVIPADFTSMASHSDISDIPPAPYNSYANLSDLSRLCQTLELVRCRE